MPDQDDLIAELRELGGRLRVPPAADQRAAVRARLARPAPRRPRARLILAGLVATVAASVTLVAPARAAVVEVVGDLLRVAGIEVRGEPSRTSLPVTPSPLPSVDGPSLEAARRVAAFPVGVPGALGQPEQVVTADPDPRGHPRVITMVFRGGTVRFDQFDGRLDTAFVKTSPDARLVDLGGAILTAAWLPGPHPLTYVGRDGLERSETARLSGPALIWTTGAVTYRLEGIPAIEEAVATARSVR
ncbi:hypothetical protein FHR83_002867 [Actinoplanes campanulatus]|uniref:DUF4367 domain-containing protein n=1 Tax=Actinoplanes campanulatus TaxID=113559 RepID=A0A7W5AG70_9ACTN|nr:hypothetical protein [Actinoplanes campanulatus]MBB3095204.1 hypothetical protein [Actinoplanes campanulatus]GGN24129.1 hypothetical protein GCM10010109_39490 [Actinoplanes campanulatus]GID34808.1 hypothetical protein Aca09nite_13140 [Actinoplanes campanulatus]